MRVDAHQHFWRYDPRRDTWIGDNMAVLKRDFLPADLEPELDASGIDATIAVQADQSVAETRFLLEQAAGNPRIAGVVGWIDLRSDALEERLASFESAEKLRGFRHIAQAEPDDDFLARPDFVRGVRAIATRGYTYDLLVYPRQLRAAIDLVTAVPEQRFVLDHIAKPEIAAGRVSPWRELVRELAANPNVYCKVSGLVTEADWRRWTPGDLQPYLDVVFEAFGTERLMFGSDWPVCLLAASYAQVGQLVTDYVEQASPGAAAADAIFGDNAARFYGARKAAWISN